MKYVDFAIAVSMFLFFFAMVLILSTNYFSNISGLTKTSEFRSIAEGIFKLLFESKGIPEDWEENSDLNPVQLGLIEEMYRIPVLVKETSGYNRTNELISVNLLFDEDCVNKTWNDSMRVFDGNGNEIPFEMSKESFCSNQFLKQAKVVWETNLTPNQNKKFYVYYSSDDSIYTLNYTDTFSTVAYWHFDEGSGNMTYDHTANDNDGKLYNGTEWNSDEPSWISGKYGYGLKFDGMNDYIEVSDSNNLKPDHITVEAWVYPIGEKLLVQTDVAIVRKLDWNNKQGYWLRWHNNTKHAEFGIGNGTNWEEIASSVGSVPLNQWTHLVGTYNGTHSKIYVNGILEDTSSYHPEKINHTTDVLRIGAATPNFKRFNGTIDEVRIWNRALSPEEINASYISCPLPIKSFPEENLNTLSPSKLNALKNVSYEDILKTLGDYKFRIEIGESE